MIRRNGFWVTAATLFTLANAVAAGFYIALGESMHGTGHGALMLVGAAVAWWLVARTERQQQTSLSPADDRLERLQQSMDAIAVEVERIGEGQRFSAKLEAAKVEERR